MEKLTAEEIKTLLELEPLEGEGGHFRQTFKASRRVASDWTAGGDGSRSALTSIYFLVTPDGFSALHLLAQDEVFHFYLGDAVEMIQWHPERGELTTFRLGPDLRRGERPQAIVPGGTWQGTRLAPGGTWALLGCNVAPGFEYVDNRIADRAFLDDVRRRFPERAERLGEFIR